MSSDLSTDQRRVPLQKRGHRRVAQLLEAAGAVFAANGYEVATMAEIAERAGGSIGALYQYFPNKDAVVRALQSRYSDEMDKRCKFLEDESGDLSVKKLAGRLVDVLVRFTEEHAAYLPLLETPSSDKRDREARNRFLEGLANVLRAGKRPLSADQAFLTASVVLRILKSMNYSFGDVKPKERKAIAREYKIALVAYLEVSLKR